MYQPLRNNAIYEHKCLENIKKLYKQAGQCDYQQQFKDIIEVAMFYTPGGVTDKSHISPITSTLIKKRSAQKPLCLFTNILEVNKKTAYHRVGSDKYKRKENTCWKYTTGIKTKTKREFNKIIKRERSLFITGLYIIHMLCNHQF